MARIASLFRYPVKGMTGQELSSAVVEAGGSFPLDRAYAIANGRSRFDPDAPKWVSKTGFLMLMRHERLAVLETRFDEETHRLTIFRDGKQVAQGQLNTRLGRQMVEQFLAGFFSSELMGPPNILAAEGHHFTDIATKGVHIVNLETVRALGDSVGVELDPVRFRANIYTEGTPAWAELDWVGRRLQCGDVEFTVFDRTSRCAAIDVDPATGVRGQSLPSAIERLRGHSDLGVYARVSKGGAISKGAEITLLA